MSSGQRWLAAASLVAIFAYSVPARAHYCRTTTVKTPADFDPAVLGECWSKGIPVYWPNECVSYDFQAAVGGGLSYTQATSAAAVAFAGWNGASCGATGSGHPSIQPSNLGSVTCGVVEYNECGPNQNVVVFRDPWPYDDAVNALALTTVSFDTVTGELYDADMEINGTVPLSVAATVPADAYDFASILAHETGHFLGLAHATTSKETMYAYLSLGEQRRGLATGDIDGICDVYPPDGTRAAAIGDGGKAYVDAAACDPTPRHGFTTECMPTPVDGGVACEPPPSSGGCSVGRDGSDRSGVVGVPLVLSLFARRRRKVRAG